MEGGEGLNRASGQLHEPQSIFDDTKAELDLFSKLPYGVSLPYFTPFHLNPIKYTIVYSALRRFSVIFFTAFFTIFTFFCLLATAHLQPINSA